MKRYNIVGYYPNKNEWYLIMLGNSNLQDMQNTLEKMRNNPNKYGVDKEVTALKIESLDAIQDNKQWWNW